MLRDEQIRIAKRLLQHVKNGTAESAPRQHRVSVSEYIDPALWAEEVDTFYKRLPIVAGMSCELPGPGTYKALDIVGIPVLLVRDRTGRLGAFMNVCRHRGAAIAAPGCGEAERFSCPYHGWTYDHAGRLVGVSHEETFGGVDRNERGRLTTLPSAERAGLIFVGLTPGMPFDIDAYLAGAAQHMGASEPETLYYGGARTVEAPNWKLVVEGHLESYHFATLHRNSIGPSTFSNCATIDRFGPHILITFANNKLVTLLDRPESEWYPLRDKLMVSQYILFPGAAVTLIGDGLFAQMIRPGADVGSSINNMVVGFHRPANDPATAADQLGFLDGVRALVDTEDYAAGRDIQRGMHSGAQTEIVFGKNEPGLIYFHEAMKSALRPTVSSAMSATG